MDHTAHTKKQINFEGLGGVGLIKIKQDSCFIFFIDVIASLGIRVSALI